MYQSRFGKVEILKLTGEIGILATCCLGGFRPLRAPGDYRKSDVILGSSIGRASGC